MRFGVADLVRFKICAVRFLFIPVRKWCAAECVMGAKLSKQPGALWCATECVIKGANNLNNQVRFKIRAVRLLFI